MLPDIIITMGGNSVLVQPLKAAIAKRTTPIKQWLICEDGIVRDSLRCLSDIFECSSLEFLKFFTEYGAIKMSIIFNGVM